MEGVSGGHTVWGGGCELQQMYKTVQLLTLLLPSPHPVLPLGRASSV